MKGAWKQTLLAVLLPFLVSLPCFYALTWAQFHTNLPFVGPITFMGLRFVRFTAMLFLAVRLRKKTQQEASSKNWNMPLLVWLAVSAGLHFNGILHHRTLVVYLNLMNSLYDQQAIIPFVTLEQIFSYPDLYWGLLFSFLIVFLKRPILPKALLRQILKRDVERA